MSKNKELQARDVIFAYLNKQNRPYSAVDIFNNLHKEHGKTLVTRALEQLAQDGKINEKTYGKQKIYFPDQKQYPVVADSELKGMDDEIQKLTEGLAEVQQLSKNKEALLGNLTGSLTTSEIKSKIASLTKEIERFRTKLLSLTKNQTTISAEEKSKIYKDNERLVKEWRKRKRLATDMTDAILENYPKGKRALLEEIGIETDEDAKVTLSK